MSSSFVEYRKNLIISSDENLGASAKNQDGNRFRVVLDQPLSIPKSARNATLSVVQSAIWHTSPNISDEQKNDQFHFTFDDGQGGGPVLYPMVIPKGLYSITELNQELSQFFNANGLDEDLFTLIANNSNQRVVIEFKLAGIQIDFTVPNSINTVLGFNAALVPAGQPSTAGQQVEGDTTASFNSLNSYLLSCSLVQEGLQVNKRLSQIIANIPIRVAAGSQNIVEPRHPLEVDCKNMVGQNINSFNVWLTDQNERDLDMLDDAFSFVIVIKYYLPMWSDVNQQDREHKTAQAHNRYRHMNAGTFRTH